MKEIETTDPKKGGEAHGLISCIIKFEFVSGLNIMKEIFEKTNILSKYIQKHEVSVHQVVDVTKRIVESIADLRNEHEF